ncbi:MAG: hypothetical protein KKH98_14625 [Spirochaetes bacterium]|nr:hypothetical protein [Spirochaetota bacterium]
MKLLKIIMILAVILSFNFVTEARAEEKPSYKVEAELFLATLNQGEINKAYDKLLENSVIKENEEAVENLKKQTSVGTVMYGKLLGSEFIKEKNYGQSIIRLIYILKCEKVPLTWEFYYYRATDKWQLISIQFNDQTDLLADK